ncbi:MAG: DUF6033 family protein [Oscillospiraceae bacterium]|nr:DUF6033 family protein [Oscillospiraceae bacterium]
MFNNAINNNPNKPTAMNIWKNDKADKTEEKKAPVLSAAAQSYLKTLQEKHGNVYFIIADYSGEDEAQRLLKQGKGEYNCLITPALLEQMATDEATRSKYEEIIANAVTQVTEMKEQLVEKSDMIKNYGFSIDGDGNINYYVLLRDGLPKDLNGGSKMVKAGSIEELMEKLDKIDEERRIEKSYEKRKERQKQIKDGFDNDDNQGENNGNKVKVEIDEDGNFDFQA